MYLYDDDHLVLVMNYSGEHCKVNLQLVEGAISGAEGSAFAPSSALARFMREKELSENIRQLFFRGFDINADINGISFCKKMMVFVLKYIYFCNKMDYGLVYKKTDKL